MSWTPTQVEFALENAAQTAQVLDALYSLGIVALAISGFWIGWNIMGEALKMMESRP